MEKDWTRTSKPLLTAFRGDMMYEPDSGLLQDPLWIALCSGLPTFDTSILQRRRVLFVKLPCLPEEENSWNGESLLWIVKMRDLLRPGIEPHLSSVYRHHITCSRCSRHSHTLAKNHESFAGPCANLVHPSEEVIKLRISRTVSRVL